MKKIHLIQFTDKPHISKTRLMYVEDNKICDGCDDHNVKCVCLSLISGGASHLCQDCIEGILESLNPSILRDKKIDEILK
jgi:hypothetical protein